MSGTTAAIISGTILLIALFLILNKDNGGAFANVIGAIGQQYANAVSVLQARS